VTVIVSAEFENVIEIDRNRNMRGFRLWSMNTEEIDRALRRICAKDFDGVFIADTLSEKNRVYWSSTPILRIVRVVIRCATENISIHSNDCLLEILNVN